MTIFRTIELSRFPFKLLRGLKNNLLVKMGVATINICLTSTIMYATHMAVIVAMLTHDLKNYCL